MLTRFLIVLFFCSAAGCVSSSVKHVNESAQLISIPAAQQRIIDYHESGKYSRDVEAKAREVIAAADKAIASGVKYPAVVISVEDVLVSTYDVRKKQGFSDNSCARKELDSNVILGILPVIKPSLNMFEYLLSRKVTVFIVSYRPESLRVSVLENLAGSGYSGWKGLYLLAPNQQADSKKFYEEIRKGLHRTGYNIVATIGVLPFEVAGEQAGTPVLYPNYIYSAH
ncbi:HAD superfamily, subfamily IIIB (Acid phosphatase) [Desulfovibrio gilichinskyi]|uniref:HAD superfamily, subfamily IIIB (Acid phosphatase) n=1 Tax=Desulfovibrio gilichinskyi TaxID=1519643 RepID=A0A1X7C8T3_9BACT|nr:HAD superfamily, subfamily IIIB (Acid phosphatase) [Desulfovibrio gilichinskyi]